MPDSYPLGRGMLVSLTASVLFAVMTAYTKLLSPLSGLDIFAWRVVWTVPCAILFVTARGSLASLRALTIRGLCEPKFAAMLLTCAALLGVETWLFLWAPQHGRMLDVSMGFFLLPIIMVIVGRVFYVESLSKLQWIAVGCASIGVIHEFFVTRSFAWPTLLVSLGYPPYLMLRRKIGGDSFVLLAAEMALMVPVACFVIWSNSGQLKAPNQFGLCLFLLPGLGVISTLALGSYLKASRMLPMAVFGMLGYVEPILLIAVSVLVLGESITSSQLQTYIPIWIGVLLMVFHSARG
ncbi:MULTISPECIES: EamA family transporter RarD [unclassified Caballeronia]|uniref:EamA family transporter RarD n=1 Tax=unclassified Caballeronia TaxID=2646786 RepID=UPI001F2CBB60|nr:MULTISPECIES: EamA family transporter RarD [unclassified Caballeronia]MCE4547320.1 EamA family transporter RarD [Caballeronia sp. PC1]MCE4575303.1 EamA family transporter RarD [Caballeronia sp. CLC5]